MSKTELETGWLAILFRLSSTFNLIANTQRELKTCHLSSGRTSRC